ncbi:MAG: nucleotidyltransferase domain-containing protein [Mariprofundaceae bacterium]|nr:nucleotidyltransferase domain-containing protein [Mariprofundaceae bacterium]
MNISAAERELLWTMLQQWLPQHVVYAFGSRVHGRQLKPFSDLDLAIMSDTPIDIDVLCALREAFAESDLPYRVDVVDFATSSTYFQAKIKEDGQLFYAPQDVE